MAKWAKVKEATGLISYEVPEDATLTVTELRELLACFPGDAEVLIYDDHRDSKSTPWYLQRMYVGPDGAEVDVTSAEKQMVVLLHGN